jgi:hypothetical protein
MTYLVYILGLALIRNREYHGMNICFWCSGHTMGADHGLDAETTTFGLVERGPGLRSSTSGMNVLRWAVWEKTQIDS